MKVLSYGSLAATTALLAACGGCDDAGVAAGVAGRGARCRRC